MGAVERRQRGEVWENLNALGRLLASAVQPYPKRSILTPVVLAVVLAVLCGSFSVIVGNLLPTAFVLLVAAVILLLIAGTRTERELHGDAGIVLEPTMVGEQIFLAIRNAHGKTAKFTGTVSSIEPVPPRAGQMSWVIPWLNPSGPSTESIEPHGMRYLSLAHGEVTRRPNDGELAGCVAFHVSGAGEIPFNYETTADVDDRKPITITVKVRRHEPPATIETDFRIEFPSDITPPAHPTIMQLGESRSTRG